MDLVRQIWLESGLNQMTGGQAIMLLVCLLLLYLGIARKFEPLLLVTIGFGGLLSNIPGAGIAEPGGPSLARRRPGPRLRRVAQ